MTYTFDQFVDDYKENILPHIRETYEQDGIIDGPARRESFNNYMDSMHKDGMLTDNQVNNWCLPDHLDSPYN